MGAEYEKLYLTNMGSCSFIAATQIKLVFVCCTASLWDQGYTDVFGFVRHKAAAFLFADFCQCMPRIFFRVNYCEMDFIILYKKNGKDWEKCQFTNELR